MTVLLKPIADLGETGIHCRLPPDWLCVRVGLVWAGLRSSTRAQPVFPFLFELQVALIFPFCHLKECGVCHKDIS